MPHLHLGIGDLCPHVGHVVAAAADLRGQLCQVGLRHLPLTHHLLAAGQDDGVLGKECLVDAHGLLHIEDLHVEGGYLLLDVVGGLVRGQAGGLQRQLGVADGHLSLARIPYGPRRIDAVAAALGGFVAALRGQAGVHIAAARLLKRTVIQGLRHTRIERGQQSGPGFAQRDLSRLYRRPILAQPNVVRQGVVHALLQRPSAVTSRHRCREAGAGSQPQQEGRSPDRYKSLYLHKHFHDSFAVSRKRSGRRAHRKTEAKVRNRPHSRGE